jgi:sec-independent protein translocase protein TatC
MAKKRKNKPTDSQIVATRDPLVGHLTDLRNRLVWALVWYVLFTGIALYFAPQLFEFLTRPLKMAMAPGSQFVSLTATELWFTYFQTGLFFGFWMALPFIAFQLWRFLGPGLYAHEKTALGLVFFFFTLLFVVGGAFGYYVFFPASFGYFLKLFSGTGILFLPSLSSYFSFATLMLIACGLIFEIPLLILFLTTVGIINVRQLWDFQRYFILIATIIGAILTPPDVISQILLSVPIILLYELGMILAFIFSGFKLGAKQK